MLCWDLLEKSIVMCQISIVELVKLYIFVKKKVSTPKLSYLRYNLKRLVIFEISTLKRFKLFKLFKVLPLI